MGTINVSVGAIEYGQAVLDRFAGPAYEADGVTERVRTGAEYKAVLIVYLNQRGFNSFLAAVQQEFNRTNPPVPVADVADHITLTPPA